MKEKISEYEKLEIFLKKIHPKAIVLRIPHENLGHVATNLNYLINDWEILKTYPQIQEIKQVGKFLNIFLKTSVFKFNLPKFNIQKTNIEYCSPNPTGQLHLGHLSGIVHGKVLCNLYKLLNISYSSEIYINNMGQQVRDFRESVQLIKEGKEPIHYKNEIIYKWAKSNEDPLLLQQNEILNQLKKMGIVFHKISFESDQEKYIDEVFDSLKKTGNLSYDNFAEQKSEGKMWSYLDQKKQHHVLKRSNNQLTYYALDLCYAINKNSRGFNRQICIMGEDHKGHVPRMTSALQLLDINYIGITSGLLKFKKNNEIIVFSKRKNNTIQLADLQAHWHQLVGAILNKQSHKNMICHVDKFQQEEKSTLMLLMENKIENLLPLLNDKDQSPDYFHTIMGDIFVLPHIIKKAVKTNDVHGIFENGYKFTYKLQTMFNKYSILELQTRLSKTLAQEILYTLKAYNKILYN